MARERTLFSMQGIKRSAFSSKKTRLWTAQREETQLPRSTSIRRKKAKVFLVPPRLESTMLISEIKIGNRHRMDMGDIEALAESIRLEGLLQPVGVTDKGELVFGARRLVAMRDVLGRDRITTRVVKVTSIIEGEYHENEVRKDFTPSERVAIEREINAEIDRQPPGRGKR